MFGYTMVKTQEMDKMVDQALRWEIENRRLRDQISIMERNARRFDSQWKNREAEHAKELEALRAKYVDELQKRLELAELVKKMEAERHDT